MFISKCNTETCNIVFTTPPYQVGGVGINELEAEIGCYTNDE